MQASDQADLEAGGDLLPHGGTPVVVSVPALLSSPERTGTKPQGFGWAGRAMLLLLRPRHHSAQWALTAQETRYRAQSDSSRHTGSDAAPAADGVRVYLSTPRARYSKTLCGRQRPVPPVLEAAAAVSSGGGVARQAARALFRSAERPAVDGGGTETAAVRPDERSPDARGLAHTRAAPSSNEIQPPGSLFTRSTHGESTLRETATAEHTGNPPPPPPHPPWFPIVPLTSFAGAPPEYIVLSPWRRSVSFHTLS
ncbi:hypothetical protein HPB50_011548 [Hyalomma asiaticum]|uniref:Uncharacterized protein n=1 Tax=Hyalomma asiaticum TaxID=266040 RepID=A0ACB7SEL6_HYAAI|nr:hypothetical protein HPB50_011548 [Hyalomma asiaticum]